VAVVFDEPLAPCGLCRQALWKFAASPRMPVWSASQDGRRTLRRSISALLPEADGRLVKRRGRRA
jgi:cytidine deaminase